MKNNLKALNSLSLNLKNMFQDDQDRVKVQIDK